MRRPHSIAGLLWLWLRMEPRRVSTLVAAAVVALVTAAAWLSSNDGGCAIDAAPYSAGMEEPDFLQKLSLRGDGTGNYAFRCARAPRWEARFRYRVLDETRLELRDFIEIDDEGNERPLGWAPQRIRYELSEGRYCFNPSDRDESCYGCRLTLGESPLPAADAYYACSSE